MSKVLYERDGRIARITLNRPAVMNAIDDEMPRLIAEAVARADDDPAVHVIVLAGAGAAFCAGYDLTYYAQGDRTNRYTQDMPWDPMRDYALMSRNTEHFMSLFRSRRPVICKVHGFAVAGGSDIVRPPWRARAGRGVGLPHARRYPSAPSARPRPVSALPGAPAAPSARRPP